MSEEALAQEPDELVAVEEPVEPVEPARPGVGEQLRLAREALGISQADVASQLKVAPRKVAAIETEQWAELPERPYLRGFIRNYARVLHVNADPLVEQFDGLTKRPLDDAPFQLTQTLHAPFPQHAPGHGVSKSAKLMAGGAVVLAVIALGIGISGFESVHTLENWFERAVGSPAPANEADATTSTNVAAGSDEARPNDAPSSVAVSDIHKPATAPASAPSAASVPLPAGAASIPRVVVAAPVNVGQQVAAAASNALLALHFDDDSWVEARRADGTVVFSQLNHAGSEQVIVEVGPLDVTIGNAPAVTLYSRGKRIDLAPLTHERVARLTLK